MKKRECFKEKLLIILLLTGNFTSYSLDQLADVDFSDLHIWATEFQGSPAFAKRIQKAYNRARILMGCKSAQQVDLNKFMYALSTYIITTHRNESMFEYHNDIPVPECYFYALHAMVEGLV